MEWRHKCSKKWMLERQNYLTASEVKALLPFTKTGRKRNVTNEDRIKILANKFKVITDSDCWSYGAAARGHLLEPYAIEEFNVASEERLYHWDDIVIPRHPSTNGLAFSPDAISIEPPKDKTLCTLNPYVNIKIGEVKCYGADKHLTIAYADKEDVEERWQIATAMACRVNITHGYLILYHPGLSVDGLVYKTWNRQDLEDEIETILKIEKDWLEFLEWFYKTSPKGISRSIITRESEIVRQLEKKHHLNP